MPSQRVEARRSSLLPRNPVPTVLSHPSLPSIPLMLALRAAPTVIRRRTRRVPTEPSIPCAQGLRPTLKHPVGILRCLGHSISGPPLPRLPRPVPGMNCLGPPSLRRHDPRGHATQKRVAAARAFGAVAALRALSSSASSLPAFHPRKRCPVGDADAWSDMRCADCTLGDEPVPCADAGPAISARPPTQKAKAPHMHSVRYRSRQPCRTAMPTDRRLCMPFPASAGCSGRAHGRSTWNDSVILPHWSCSDRRPCDVRVAKRGTPDRNRTRRPCRHRPWKKGSLRASSTHAPHRMRRSIRRV